MSIKCPFELDSQTIWRVLDKPWGKSVPPEDATYPVCGVVYKIHLTHGVDQDITEILDWFYVVAYTAGKPVAKPPCINLDEYAGTYGGYTADQPKPTIWQRVLGILFKPAHK